MEMGGSLWEEYTFSPGLFGPALPFYLLQNKGRQAQQAGGTEPLGAVLVALERGPRRRVNIQIKNK